MDFRISKIKMCQTLLAGTLMLWGGYMLIISNIIIAQIVGWVVIILFGSMYIYICYNLFKPIFETPIMIINSEGIYHKQISCIPIPWSNIRLIWKSSMTIPRILYIETKDHSPSKCPHNIYFTVLTPGFSAAWSYLNKNYPEKIRGKTDETSRISL
jgi:hypothetical protein